MKKLLVVLLVTASLNVARAQLFTPESFSGALLGAGLGSAIGYGAGNAGKGAAIGAASGWFLGTIANDYRRSQYDDYYGRAPYRNRYYYSPGYGYAPYRVAYAANPVVVYQQAAAPASQTAATATLPADPPPAYQPRPARPMDGANSLFGR